MDSPGNNKELIKPDLLQEPEASYEKAAVDLLRDALRSSYTERFLMTTRLYKIGQMLANAKVTHASSTLNK